MASRSDSGSAAGSPPHNMFALDIGGSLAKLAYYTIERRRTTSLVRRDRQSSADETAGSTRQTATPPPTFDYAPEEMHQGKLNLCVFPTTRIEDCIDFIEAQVARSPGTAPPRILATGGGAHKYSHMIQQRLRPHFERRDEMECLIRGCNFLMHKVADEVYTFNAEADPPRSYHRMADDDVYPYLLANIGSGVSILRIDGPSSFTRIDGSAIGGGTAWGLANLLTDASSFDELLELAAEGESKHIDMVVSDIYGEKTPESLGLDPNLLASSFGKAAWQQTKEGLKATSQNGQASNSSGKASTAGNLLNKSIARSLIEMVSFNIAQIACLNARLEGISRIVFGGFFIRNRPATMKAITFATQYWGKGQVQALFLRHEGYLGAIGAFLAGLPSSKTMQAKSSAPSIPVRIKDDLYAEGEATGQGSKASAVGQMSTALHLSASRREFVQMSSFIETFAIPEPQEESTPLPSFSLIHRTSGLVRFPHLRRDSDYAPDTIDLMRDSIARSYWLDIFRRSAEREAARAIDSTAGDGTARARAAAFMRAYGSHLDTLGRDGSAYGELNIRILLELRQQCLRAFCFEDIYAGVKQRENQHALSLLPSWLEHLDGQTERDRMRSAIRGVLAGNAFDWGAKSVVERLTAGTLSFHEEQLKLAENKWLVDHFETWYGRLDQYNKVTIFVDNSGADVLLGIVPLARELLRRGKRVILAANSEPVLNDVTSAELSVLLESVQTMCGIIDDARKQSQLMVMENGSGSPCLDMLRIDETLAQEVQDSDLIVLEGMGRAVHTNYEATFACDALKLAMIKDGWLAKHLGGQLYDVVCRFDAAHGTEKHDES